MLYSKNVFYLTRIAPLRHLPSLIRAPRFQSIRSIVVGAIDWGGLLDHEDLWLTAISMPGLQELRVYIYPGFREASDFAKLMDAVGPLTRLRVFEVHLPYIGWDPVEHDGDPGPFRLWDTPRNRACCSGGY